MPEDPSITQPKAEAKPARSGAPQLGGLVPRGAVPSQRCVARSSRTGEQCKRFAIVGGAVCPTHGGSSPQVRDAARRRILAFAPTAVQILMDLAQSSESDAVRVRAVDSLLDRAGLKVAEELVVVPQEATNAALDAAIADALRRRDIEVAQEEADEILDAEVVDQVEVDSVNYPEILGPLDD